MPQAPMLPADQMLQQSGAAGTNPLNFLIAAADMSKNGQLSAGAVTPQRSMPKGQSMNLPTQAKRPRKHIQIIK